MKTKISNKTFYVLLHPIAWSDKMLTVLHVIDRDKNTRTTYDKKRGKQVWNTPHNIPVNTKVPVDCIELPNHIERMKQIYGIM